MRPVFLAANVLFPAAYRKGAGLLEPWKLPGTQLLTSGYAAEEARRNLDSPERLSRLNRLLASMELVAEAPGQKLPAGLRLPEKDEPILRAALSAGATHLLTGDLRDFGAPLGHRIGRLRIETPGMFLRSSAKSTVLRRLVSTSRSTSPAGDVLELGPPSVRKRRPSLADALAREREATTDD